MRRGLVFVTGVLVGAVLFSAWSVRAQTPPPPPMPCEEKLDVATWQYGESLKETAQLRSALRGMTKERDEAKAALADQLADAVLYRRCTSHSGLMDDDEIKALARKIKESK